MRRALVNRAEVKRRIDQKNWVSMKNILFDVLQNWRMKYNRSQVPFSNDPILYGTFQ